jgi:hypothetical protein
VVPPLPIFRHKVSWRTNFEFPTMSSSLSGDIPPQIAFVSYRPSASKMVDFLVGIHIFKSTSSNKTSPKTVPTATFRNNLKPSNFKCIDNAIISMS